MTKLLKKREKHKWTKDCDVAFAELKWRLTSASVLVVLDGFVGMVMYNDDASGRGLGVF